jgi:hypothetical protein
LVNFTVRQFRIFHQILVALHFHAVHLSLLRFPCDAARQCDHESLINRVVDRARAPYGARTASPRAMAMDREGRNTMMLTKKYRTER